MDNSPDPHPAHPSEKPPPPATLRQVFRAVAWGFFGVRKRQHMQQDWGSIRPYQFVIVGLTMAAIFVVTLLFIVRIVLKVAAP